MPLYQFRCPKCQASREELLPFNRAKHGLRCDCGGTQKLMMGSPFVKIWKPLTLQHIADKPMTFEKEGDLRRYCREHKLASAALL